MSPMLPGDWRELLAAAGQERELGTAGVRTVTPVCSSLLCNKWKSPVVLLLPARLTVSLVQAFLFCPSPRRDPALI